MRKTQKKKVLSILKRNNFNYRDNLSEKTGRRSIVCILTMLLLLFGIQEYLSFSTSAAQEASDIVFSKAAITYKNNSGTDVSISTDQSNPTHLPDDPTTLYYRANYETKYAKIIGNMNAANSNTVSYLLPGTDDTNGVNFSNVPSQDIFVNIAENSSIKVGSLSYKTENQDGVLQNGLYITYIKEDGDNGLQKLYEACKTEDSTIDAGLTYTGTLSYSGILSKGSNAYDTTIEVKDLQSNSGYVSFMNPNPLSNPDFEKIGTYNDADGTVTWTFTIEQTANSPMDYLLTDVLPTGSELASHIDAIQVTTTTAGSSTSSIPVSSGDGSPSAGTPAANNAYWDRTAKQLHLNLHFNDNEQKKTITVNTEITDGKTFLANGTLSGSISSVTNTCTLSNQEPTLPDQHAEGIVNIPGPFTENNIKKTGVFNSADGTITWTIIVRDVNYSWMKNLVIYDKVDIEWKLTDSGVSVYSANINDNGVVSKGTSLTDAECLTADPSSPGTAISPMENSSVNQIDSGFKLTLFNESTRTGCAENYYIEYTMTPVDPDYWTNHGNQDTTTDNTVWMSYEWKDGKGPGKNTLHGPSISDFPVGSTAVTKSKLNLSEKSTGYDPATGTFQWQVVLNPHKIPMTSPITLTDTMGTSMKLYSPNGPLAEPNDTGYVLSSQELTDVFGNGAANIFDSVTYKKDTAGNYLFEAVIKQDAVYASSTGQTATLTYKTISIVPDDYAGNTSQKSYSNNVTLNYTLSTNSVTAAAEASDKLTSQVIEKKSLGYDYSSTSGTSGLLKWQVVVNQNKMVLSTANGDTNLKDFIDSSQEFVISTDAPFTVTTDSANIGSTNWGGTTKRFTALSSGGTSADDNPSVIEIDGNVVLTFGKPENINNQTLTITFYTKLKNPDDFFDMGKGSAPKTQETAKNGTQGTQETGAFLTSPLSTVQSTAEWTIYNRLLNKTHTTRANNTDPVIHYVLEINPMKLTLPNNFKITDVMGAGLILDASSIKLYEATTGNSKAVTNRDNRCTVTKSGAGDLIDKGSLTINMLNGCYQMDFAFQFDTGNWDSTARNKTYVLEYDAIASSTGTNVSLQNNVSVSGTFLPEISASDSVEYSYNESAISGIAGSYGRISILKQTSASGNAPLQGAVFTITDQYGNVRTATTNASGSASFTLLPRESVYTLQETSSPAGFVTAGLPRTIAAGIKISGSSTGNFTWDPSANSQSGTLSPTLTNNRVYNFTVRNHPAPFIISFSAVDQYGRPVQGAEFQLYSSSDTANSNPLLPSPAVSDANGNVTFDLSSLGDGEYKFIQTLAPAGIKFDPATAIEYYFTLDLYGNNNGLHQGSITGTVVASVVNISTNPPPVNPVTPPSPDASSTHVNTSVKSPLPQEDVENTAMLPKTGGLRGLTLFFLLGVFMISAGIYLSYKGRPMKEQLEEDYNRK